MNSTSYARAVLGQWGVLVEDIPTSDLERKKEADFIATFGAHRALIEEKAKEDDPAELFARKSVLESGQSYASSVPFVRDNRLSGINRAAVKQLQSSSDKPHDFRLVWFTSTGTKAEAKYEQYIASLYGLTNIIEMNSPESRRCYFFRNSDFHRHAPILDAAVAAYLSATVITAKLCLNPLSPRYARLRTSELVSMFGDAVEDPGAHEADGTAFILDTDLDRHDEGPLLKFLQSKYATKPLMHMNLGHITATVLVREDER